MNLNLLRIMDGGYTKNYDKGLLLLISVFLQRITEGISLDCGMASSALSCFYGKHVTFGNLV